MDIKNLVKNNTKFVVAMIIVITLGVVGIAYAITIAGFNPIGINTTAEDINATVGYEEGSDGSITSTGELLPIDDTLVTLDNPDTRVLKVTFSVTGVDTNPKNTIYDISLRNINIDCELKTNYFKWRLYREQTKISEGTFSPAFDAMTNNRMVLTETQEDLTTTTKNYTLLIWISESCTGDITTCDTTLSQNKYLNKTFSASIKVELSTKSKKALVRTTSSEEVCDYIETSIPVCNDVTYNGTSQTLVYEGETFTLVNPIGINAGYYSVIAKLKDDYKWTDGTTSDKVITCQINKKAVTITTLPQTITYGKEISSSVDKVGTSGLLSGHSLYSIELYSDIINVGTGLISGSNAKVIDASGNNVTSNYNFIYNNTGIITINSAS